MGACLASQWRSSPADQLSSISIIPVYVIRLPSPLCQYARRHHERWQQVGTFFAIDQSEGGGVLQVALPAIPVAFFRSFSTPSHTHLHVIQWPCLSCLRIGLYTSHCLLLLTYHLQISDRSALAQRPRPIHPICTQRMIALRLYFCFLLCIGAVTCLYCLSEGTAVNLLRLLLSSSVLIDSQ